MKRHMKFAVLALGLVPASGVAQQSATARIDAAERTAAAAGIPASLLESRVAEGKAKGIPMDRIAAAVERRAATLAEAQRAMAGIRALSPADLAAGADAVEAGIGADALRAVIVDARDEDRPVAIAVLTYLHVERGLPVDQAVARVSRAMAEGPDALRNLPVQAAAAAQRRGPPEGLRDPARPGNGNGNGQGGPPAAVPTPGQKPGAGRPDEPGRGPPDQRPAGPEHARMM